MYYEEKCEDGSWFWRGTPDGKWERLSYLMLEEKLNQVLEQPKRSA